MEYIYNREKRALNEAVAESMCCDLLGVSVFRCPLCLSGMGGCAVSCVFT